MSHPLYGRRRTDCGPAPQGCQPTKEELKGYRPYQHTMPSGLDIECHLELESECLGHGAHPDELAFVAVAYALVNGTCILETMDPVLVESIESDAMQSFHKQYLSEMEFVS